MCMHLYNDFTKEIDSFVQPTFSSAPAFHQVVAEQAGIWINEFLFNKHYSSTTESLYLLMKTHVRTEE